MSYNGYKNYETWAVGLYLDGNYDGEGTYREVLSLAEEVQDEIDESNEYSTVQELRQYELADRLKDYTENMLPDLGGTLAADLIGAAMSEVDWHELAEGKLSELAEA